MPNIFASNALLPKGWKKDVLIEIDDQGIITSAKANQKPDKAERVETIIPGMPNVHSHAFQRAMAGLTEHQKSGNTSFWAWRETMYKFLGNLNPDDVQSIAAQLYIELIKSGYTHVCEFHYLHHDPKGKPYANLIAMSESIISAADTAGIGLTLLPTLYMASNFGGEPPNEGQRRFINTVDNFAIMFDKLKDKAQLGLGLHSLRAVPPEALKEALKLATKKMPIHMHVSEQLKEVKDCIAWSGIRPGEWLLENHDLSDQWCLIHGTHLSDDEIHMMAETEALIGLCPTTEGNLGDGIFPLKRFLEAKGQIALGTDSHISVSPVEDLRLLEYSQRLTTQTRTVVATPDEPHTGARLWKEALKGGGKASGVKIGAIDKGYRADILVLEMDSPILTGKQEDFILDSLVFSGNQNVIRDVMVAGTWQVKDYKHRNEEPTFKTYKNALQRITS